MKKHGIELVCFDINKTLVEETTWDDLNIALGMTREEDERYIQEFNQGKITYRQWINILQDIYLKRGRANRKTIIDSIAKYSYKPGAKDLVHYLREQGYKIALISGSIDIMVGMVAKDLDIDLVEANNIFVFNDHDDLTKITTFDEDDLAKLHHLESFCRELEINLGQCACIGDGDNDIKLFEATKHGITFTGSKIAPAAWQVIDQLSDIKNIL